MELLTVKGAVSKTADTLSSDLHGDFGQSARPLACLQVGAI